MGYTPHVLVVGGGATGTAVARDLAMRSLDVTLVERGPLASGATGHMHGLLHSGARYADTDPASARECIEENRVLREIAPECITDTGGLFVQHPDDPVDFIDKKHKACHECEIPVEKLSGDEARELEPGLSEDVTAALRVPDAAVDPYRLTVTTATSAKQYGAEILTDTKVANLICEDYGVSSALLPSQSMDGTNRSTDVDYVVNAAGAWAGDVAAQADLEVSMTPAKGALAVVDVDAETVVNRCRPRDEGDILVPHGDRAVLGATDVPVDDPDDFDREDWETELLLEELTPVVPAVADATVETTFWGVRPLYAPAAEHESTDVTRGFEIIDHEERDDCWGISTVVGGKFTTHRLIAEAVGDHVCAKFGIDRECQTATTPLPSVDMLPVDTNPPFSGWE